jgi:hypothetical protein
MKKEVLGVLYNIPHWLEACHRTKEGACVHNDQNAIRQDCRAINVDMDEI